MTFPTVDCLLEHALETAVAIDAEFETRFEFEVSLGLDHTRLLHQDFTESGPPEILVSRAFDRGRVLLHGEGGAGKSSLANRLVANRLRQQEPALKVDLRHWRPSDLDLWRQADSLTRSELLLEGSVEVASSSFLSTLGPARSLLLVLDGLNETPMTDPTQILEAADEIATRYPNVGVLVTDRLSGRELPNKKWQVALLTRVIAPPGFLGETKPLVENNALFLNLQGRYLESGGDKRTDILDSYFENLKLDDQELRDASEAAANVYLNAPSTVFSYEDFSSVAGPEATKKLSDGGALIQDDLGCAFKHHLYHDDLAGRWLAANPTHWTLETFKAMTLDANSFDVLALTLARVSPGEDSDLLITKIYDFNYYGSAYALAEADEMKESGVSVDTRFALLVLLTERQWDQVLPTVKRVVDALWVFRDPLAEQVRTTESMQQLLALVRSHDAEISRIQTWKDLFLSRSSRGELTAALSGPDALLGWTSANVLRRVPLDEPAEEEIHAAMRSDDEVVRWRAAHAAGGRQINDFVRDLIELTFSDPEQLVSYGAVRSLIDTAAADEEFRTSILVSLTERAEDVVARSKVDQELWRALQRVDPPPGWNESVSDLVVEVWRASDSAGRERWADLAARLETLAVNPSPLTNAESQDAS